MEQGPVRFWRFVAVGMILGPLTAAALDKLSPIGFWRERWEHPILAIIGFALASGLVHLLAAIPPSVDWDQEFNDEQLIAFLISGAGCIAALGLLRSLVFGTSQDSMRVVPYAFFLLLPFLAGLLLDHIYESRKLAAQVQASRSQIRSLEAQINPHFFHNTLNTIAALIPSQPAAAQQTVRDLGDMFRHTMEANRSERVPLTEEVSFVERYLHIEKVRFDQRLTFSAPPPAELRGLEIPSLVLQPLVENAVRHGIAKRIDGGEVRIQLQRTSRDYTVRVTNPIEEGSPPTDFFQTGHALSMTRERLALIYGNKARLHAVREGDSVSVGVTIPISA